LETCVFQQQEQEVLAPELSLEYLFKVDYFFAIAFFETEDNFQLAPGIRLGWRVRTLSFSPDSLCLALLPALLGGLRQPCSELRR